MLIYIFLFISGLIFFPYIRKPIIFENISKCIPHKIPQLNCTMDNRKFTVSHVHSSAIQIYFPCRPRVSPGPRWSVVTTWPYPRVHFDVRSGCGAFRIKPELVRISRGSRPSILVFPTRACNAPGLNLYNIVPEFASFFFIPLYFMLFDFFIHLSRADIFPWRVIIASRMEHEVITIARYKKTIWNFRTMPYNYNFIGFMEWLNFFFFFFFPRSKYW